MCCVCVCVCVCVSIRPHIHIEIAASPVLCRWGGWQDPPLSLNRCTWPREPPPPEPSAESLPPAPSAERLYLRFNSQLVAGDLNQLLISTPSRIPNTVPAGIHSVHVLQWLQPSGISSQPLQWSCIILRECSHIITATEVVLNHHSHCSGPISSYWSFSCIVTATAVVLYHPSSCGGPILSCIIL